jgi:hypothetical protein
MIIGVTVRAGAGPKSQNEIDHEQSDPSGQHECADGGDHVQHVPSHRARIGPDAAWHAEEAGEMHGQEGDVEAEEHQPEHPFSDSLGQSSPAHHRRPMIEGRKERKDHSADQHIMEMGDDEIAVVDLEIEGRDRHHDAGEAAEREDEQESEDEERRRGDSEALAPRRDGRDPGEDLNAGWNRDRHAGGGEEAEAERRQPRRIHVMHPETEAEESGRDERDDDEPSRRSAREDGREEDEPADDIGPDGEGAEAREEQIARREHLRQQQNAERLEPRHGEEEHHRGAVDRENLIVERLRDESVVPDGELRAHDERAGASTSAANGSARKRKSVASDSSTAAICSFFVLILALG